MPTSNNTASRVFGGSPLAVLGRLILISILVGVVLAALGLDPFDILQGIERLIRSIWNMGFDAFRWLWRYFLLGAVIVIPIWIIMRVVNAPRERRSAARPNSQQEPLLPTQEKETFRHQGIRTTFSNITASLVATFGVVIVYGVYLAGILGWAYWIWLSFHFGSFGMFVFGILGPLAMIAGTLGFWFLLFGIPLWLLKLIH